METLAGLFGDIADAIREREASTEEIAALDFPDRIRSIAEEWVPEPSSGEVHALMYEDGFMSIQYGDVAYDVAEHGSVAHDFSGFMPEAGTTPASAGWPWNDDAVRGSLVYVRIRHSIPFAACDEMFLNCTGLVCADMGSADMSGCTSLCSMFYGASSLGFVIGCRSWDTCAVTSFRNLFAECASLKFVDVSTWDTSSALTTRSTFYNCSSLTSIDVSRWDVSRVENMKSMFYNCKALTSLDVSGWRPDAVTTAQTAFAYCGAIPLLDLSSWVAGSLVDCTEMFMDCNIQAIQFGEAFGGRLTSIGGMFRGAKFTTLDLRGVDVSACKSLNYIFYCAKSLVVLDISTWVTSQVTNMSYFLNNCPSLTTVYVGDGWSTASATSPLSPLSGDSKLVGGNGTTYSVGGNDFSYARADLPDSPGYFTYKAADAE